MPRTVQRSAPLACASVTTLSDGVVALRPLTLADAEDHLAGKDDDLVRRNGRVVAATLSRQAWPGYWEPLIAPTAAPEVVETTRVIAFSQRVEDVVLGVRVFHSRPDRSAFLRTWPGPVTIVSGEYDIAPERSRALAGTLPDARFPLIGSAGHYVPMEAAAELRQIILAAAT